MPAGYCFQAGDEFTGKWISVNYEPSVLGGQTAFRGLAAVSSRFGTLHPDGPDARMYVEMKFLDWGEVDPIEEYCSGRTLPKDMKERMKELTAPPPPVDLNKVIQPSKKRNWRKKKKGQSEPGDGRSHGPDETPAAPRFEGQGIRKADQKTTSGPRGHGRSSSIRSVLESAAGPRGREFTPAAGSGFVESEVEEGGGRRGGAGGGRGGGHSGRSGGSSSSGGGRGHGNRGKHSAAYYASQTGQEDLIDYGSDEEMD